jgi:hypothetical protein
MNRKILAAGQEFNSVLDCIPEASLGREGTLYTPLSSDDDLPIS